MLVKNKGAAQQPFDVFIWGDGSEALEPISEKSAEYFNSNEVDLSEEFCKNKAP